MDGSLLLLGLAMVAALSLSERLGAIFRQRTARSEGMGDNQPASHVLTSIFGLLALLMGFTFSMVLNRYDQRRADVVAEANAISSAAYRASLLEPASQLELRRTLVKYTQLRVAYGKAWPDKRPSLAGKSAEMRRQLSLTGLRAARTSGQANLALALNSSVNEVNDVGAKRESTMEARIPTIVFVTLASFLIIAAFTMGYAHPLKQRERLGMSHVLFTLLALATILILDLDRPTRGSIVISQLPIEDVLADLQEAQVQ